MIITPSILIKYFIYFARYFILISSNSNNIWLKIIKIIIDKTYIETYQLPKKQMAHLIRIGGILTKNQLNQNFKLMIKALGYVIYSNTSPHRCKTCPPHTECDILSLEFEVYLRFKLMTFLLH